MYTKFIVKLTKVEVSVYRTCYVQHAVPNQPYYVPQHEALLFALNLSYLLSKLLKL